MLVQTRVAFSLRCPQCGASECDMVSLFDLSGDRSVRLNCTCGTHKLTVAARRGTIWLQIPCYLCEQRHFVYYSVRELFAPGVHNITCAETDLQLGWFGDPGALAEFAHTGRSELDRLLEDAAFGEYFDSPTVMYGILNHIHELSEKGKLGCQCGSPKIGVDIYPERLDLHCSDCGGKRSILAATDDDLLRVKGQGRIMIGDELSGRPRSGTEK
jgi:hypothetical protein